LMVMKLFHSCVDASIRQHKHVKQAWNMERTSERTSCISNAAAFSHHL
jgi:hypothetical protein